jgi:dTDP-glucose pyrophosphorylase
MSVDWKQLVLNENDTVLKALEVLNKYYQFAVVLDRNNRLIGVVADGDIRRGLLKGVSVQDTVLKVTNTNPKKIFDNKIPRKFSQFNSALRCIPVVDKENRVVDIVILDQIFEQRQNTVILMAGGMGARLGDLTKECPKPLLKVNNRPILELIIEKFKRFGFNDFVLSVNYKSEMIKEYFQDGSHLDVNVSYIEETKRMGTAGCLSLFTPKNDQPIVVMNGDLLTDFKISDFVEDHIMNKYVASMAARNYDFTVPFGVINVDERGKIQKIVEKPIHTFFVNAGIYCLSPEILKYIPKDSYFDMPDFFNYLIENKFNTAIYPIHEYWLDIGRVEDYQKANIDFTAK